MEWKLIQKSLDLFIFGSSIIRWTKTFYTNTESAVLHNGHTTNYFKLTRGVRQGCSLSPYFFILGAEILAARIRQETNIEGIKIFETEHKISQFADDTSLFLSQLIMQFKFFMSSAMYLVLNLIWEKLKQYGSGPGGLIRTSR